MAAQHTEMSRRDIGAIVLLLLWAAAFFFRLTDADLPPSDSDTTRYFVPALAFLRDQLAGGHFPLWNPHQLAGYPFLALHSPGAAYPLLVPLLLFPAHIAATLHAVLHVFLAAVFTFAFARSAGLNRSGAVAAAVAFAGSQQVVAMASGNTAYLSTYTWLPAIFWLIRRLVSEPTVRSSVLFAFAVALCLLGGYSQGFLFIVQAGFLYAVYLLIFTAEPGQRVRALSMLAMSGVLALGLVAVQLLPTIEHAASATRDLDGLTFRQAALGSVGWKQIVQGLTGQGRQALGLPFLFVPLTVVGLLWRRARSEALFFLFLFLVTLDFMRGSSGAVFPLYFRLPAGDVFRMPIRMGFVMNFAAAALVGIGVSGLVEWARRWPRSTAAISVSLVALVGGDQFLRNAPTQAFEAWTNPAEIYGPSKAAAVSSTLGSDRFFLVGSSRQRTLGEVHGGFMVGAYEPLLPGAYAAFFDIPEEMIWHGQLYVIPPRRALKRRPRSIAQSPDLLDLLSVRHYIDVSPGGARPLPRILGSRPTLHDDVRVYERSSAVPRAYIVHEVIAAGTPAEALSVVRSAGFDPRRAAVVEEALEPLPPAQPGAAEEARILENEANRVVVGTVCQGDCLLVLTDLYDPGWSAAVDGREADLLRVNGLVRGVRLPDGAHTVTFTYFPRSVSVGLALSVLSLLVALGLLFSVTPRSPT